MTAFTMKAMMAVPTTASNSVTLMALTCSTQRPPFATNLARPFLVAGLAEAANAWLAANDVFGHGPNKGGNGSGERCGGEGVCRDGVSSDCATGIESVPADPEHAGADHAKNHAVRGHRFLAETKPLAEDQT